MRALVVYESMWGNTRAVAEAVARGAKGGRAVECRQVVDDDLTDLDLLVVGGPTHAFSMSRPSTRQDAHRQGADAPADVPGIREWLAALPDDLETPVATFDTRVQKVRHLPGSAAKAAEKELRHHHHGQVLERASFFVLDTPGPLAEGELERAEAWGAWLATRVGLAADQP